MKINNKAFTLIELLAVIVILAIIALIATPIVLNIINDSKESAQLRSAEMYLKGVETSVATATINKKKVADGTYPITKEGNICLVELTSDKLCSDEDKTLKVEMNGETPSSGTVTDLAFAYSNKKTIVKTAEGSLIYKTSSCTLIDKDGDSVASLSDEIECAGEYFHVIENDGKTISMLAKYNLDVGNYNTGTSSIVLEPISNPTRIQNEKARGNIFKATGTGLDYANVYGIISFATNSYWRSSGLKAEYGTSYPAWVYTDKDGNVDKANNIYTHVENYESYLKGKGVASASATLISYEQLEKLGCDPDTSACASTINGQTKGGTAPSWVYYTSYWSGSVKSDVPPSIWAVSSSGSFGGDVYSLSGGVRPVVNISVSEI